MFRLEARRKLIGADPGRHCKRADVITGGRDPVREAAVGAGVSVCRLLAEETEARVPDHHVVALGPGGPESIDAARGKELVADDLVE